MQKFEKNDFFFSLKKNGNRESEVDCEDCNKW